VQCVDDDVHPVLQVVGEYHLGEFVNRFRAGSLVMKMPDSEAAAIPTMLFATINGVIGLVASLPKAQFEFLNRLQVWSYYTDAACLHTDSFSPGSDATSPGLGLIVAPCRRR
jgi:CPSF A subunit region